MKRFLRMKRQFGDLVLLGSKRISEGCSLPSFRNRVFRRTSLQCTTKSMTCRYDEYSPINSPVHISLISTLYISPEILVATFSFFCQTHWPTALRGVCMTLFVRKLETDYPSSRINFPSGPLNFVCSLDTHFILL